MESKKGESSTFTVDIPLKTVTARREVPEQAVRSDGSSILCGKHILIVEDNELNAEILSALLEREGASFDICENGKAALDTFVHAAPGTYDLILMDVQMPVMNGYEATSAIRDSSHLQARTIPIIAMKANAFTEDIQDALRAGMNAHVAKPVDMNVLEDTIRTVLGAGRG